MFVLNKKLIIEPNVRVGVIVCILSSLILGLYPSTAKVAYYNGANVAFILLITTVARLLALSLVALYKKIPLMGGRHALKPSVYAGVCQALSIVGVFGAAYFIPTALVITIVFTYSSMVLVVSAYRKETQFNWLTGLATLSSFLGLAFVLGVFNAEITYAPLGIGLAVMAAVATCIRVCIFSAQSGHKHPLTIGVETFSIALLFLIVFSLWQQPIAPHTALGWQMASISALTLGIATVGMFYGIALLGAYRFSMFTKLEPIFATVFGVIIAGEALSLSHYLGIIIVVLSLLALQLFDKNNA